MKERLLFFLSVLLIIVTIAIAIITEIRADKRHSDLVFNLKNL